MPGLITPLCLTCIHFQGVVPDVGYVCAAFGETKSIPEDILANGADHRLAYKGDGGKRYQLAGEEELKTRRLEVLGWSFG